MALAQGCGASVTALYVSNKTAVSPRRARGSRLNEQANAIADELERMARRYGVRLKTEVRRDVLPNEAILAQVRRAQYDLLVMGVSRRPGQKLFLAAAVLKRAPGALLFVAT
jgi:nucleotide-binding universal stress UspA family protein